MKMSLLVYFILPSIFSICLGSAPASTGGSQAEDSSGVNSESTKVIQVGKNLTLVCMIPQMGDSEPHVKWFKNNEPLTEESDRYKIFNVNSTLVFPIAESDDVGTYRCQIENVPFNISVISITYKRLPESVTVFQEDKLTLKCEVEGDPFPIVSWSKDGKDVLDTLDVSHYTLKENDKGVLNATFFVEKAGYEDRGEYICHISSEGLDFNTTSFVRVKDMYAALWPFLGICAEVLILCIIIFIYEKRRMKIEFEESDNDQPENKTSGHNKDLRHRK